MDEGDADNEGVAKVHALEGFRLAFTGKTEIFGEERSELTGMAARLLTNLPFMKTLSALSRRTVSTKPYSAGRSLGGMHG